MGDLLPIILEMDRGSGILLHITSLPSAEWIGNFGPGAFEFADFLVRSRQRYWQVLPLTPPSPGEGNSPYSCSSAFAGNTLLVSSEILARDGLISQNAIPGQTANPDDRVDYEKAIKYKTGILGSAYSNFAVQRDKSDYDRFVTENSYWLDDYVLYVALKKQFRQISWVNWPPEVRDRQPQAMGKYRMLLSEEIDKERFAQYEFFNQWMSLKEYCNKNRIQIVGDLPIYLSCQSADVWAHPEIFKLDEQKNPRFVSGVPPDYFSNTGQLWGNPVYDWNKLKETGFEWWLKRIEHNLKLFDILRIDHFRGLAAYWEIPAGEKTAINGHWVEVPGMDYFNILRERYPSLPLIAEDLGTITPDVKEFIAKLDLPGMKVLLFAFGDSLQLNPYAPHNHVKNSVVYTGTHDNNTVRGWYENEASDIEKFSLAKYLGLEISPENAAWLFVKMAEESVADMAILPMQDILGLDARARMNTPSTTAGNWQWRLSRQLLTSDIAGKLGNITEICGRIT